VNRISRYACILAASGAAIVAQETSAPAPPSQDTAQTPPAATPAPPAATPAPSPWTQKGIDFYLLGDVYYTLNFNHPDSGVNGLYNFDTHADQAHLNFAKFSMEHSPGPVGFRVDVGYGNTLDMISATDRAPEGMKYLEQVYIDFKPKSWHGVQLDVGKFVTSAGAEVIESNNNWNYSRSLLFAWAIPYYHLGLRTTIPVTKTFSTGVQLVNGWNNVKDNNSGKSFGIVGNFTWKKASWSNTYYSGPENNDTNKGWRQLYDTVILLNPNDKTGIYINADYGANKYPGPGRAKWYGVAAAARYQLTKRFAIAPRAEIFDDADGFSTGVKQTVKEITMTGEMKVKDYLLGRLEFRRDNSNEPFFDRGAQMAVAHAQTTIQLALIAFFGPKK
jgi:hypothetical protein